MSVCVGVCVVLVSVCVGGVCVGVCVSGFSECVGGKRL